VSFLSSLDYVWKYDVTPEKVNEHQQQELTTNLLVSHTVNQEENKFTNLLIQIQQAN